MAELSQSREKAPTSRLSVHGTLGDNGGFPQISKGTSIPPQQIVIMSLFSVLAQPWLNSEPSNFARKGPVLNILTKTRLFFLPPPLR